MKRKGLLAVALLVGFSVNSAHADEVVLPATPAEVVADPGVSDGPEGTPRKHWYPGYLLLHPNERPSLVRYYHNQDWFCCRATHFGLGCSSLCAEYNFIFGSCRTFYGEPCYKGKQPPSGPGGAAAYGQPGCNCP